MNALISDVMSWISLTVRPECPAAEALIVLAEADAEVLFVVDADQRCLGLVTGYELLKADVNGSLADSTAEQLMHRRFPAVTPEQPIGEAVKLFREAAWSHVPVLRDGRLVGAIERNAVLRWLCRRRDDATGIASPKFLQHEAAGVTALS